MANYDQTSRICPGNGDGTFMAGADISDNSNSSWDIDVGNLDGKD